ncbi:unnamed protein product [Sordaria macrospora k-hell]|uniref:WGS project CABT00000000 data, contig 2.23 n=1 Tax=Sordaria macrospora (strain ATCC MYA-333 / DSM 997 / K(L3346) / K-hell) TaxID=771870 RepID=F7W326_SORMK|nr:uncharacterized protein SMAC_02250 [Sordaria macrospora k-hell]CCC12028.1 unnamed protein product [Sordaria macrospora k-hell]
MNWPTTFSALSTLLIVLLTSCPPPPTAAAIPTYSHSHLDSEKTSNALPLQARALGGILICNGPNATQPCAYSVYEMETCYNLPAPFFRNASTFALDEGVGIVILTSSTRSINSMSCGEICTSPEGCTLGGVSSQYEHKFNLSAVGWDHYISSFECHLGGAPSVP